jgi:hypothetical protein
MSSSDGPATCASGREVSREMSSKITDQIVDDMIAWQSRPLDPLYAVLVIDCLVIKMRGSQVVNRPVYVAIGVNLDGERDGLKGAAGIDPHHLAAGDRADLRRHMEAPSERRLRAEIAG